MLVRSGTDPEWRSPKTTAYEDEATLRDLIAGSPTLLPGVEEPVAAVTELGISGGGSADVVMVDAAGAITIVECKLKKNPEIRMRVIGQVFWYAAALWELEYEELERAFGERGVPSLAAPFAEESEWEETAFRDAVSDNLSSGAFRLVIAVDEITDELKRAVLYINHHTVDEVGLLALELNYTEHEGVEMLIPEVYGEESAEPGTPTKRRWDEKSFLEKFENDYGADVTRVAREIIEWSRSANWRDYWGAGAKYGSFVPILDSGGREFFPFALWTSGDVEIGFRDLAEGPPFDDIELRREFQRRLNEIAGVSIPDDRIERSSTFELALLAASPEALDSFKRALDWFNEKVLAVPEATIAGNH